MQAAEPVSLASLAPAASDAVLAKLRGLATADPAALSQTGGGGAGGVRTGALFARLKALNRAANAAARSHKQLAVEARHEMDGTHLGLQNLLYEKRHLEREIEKCRQFASVYQDIPLYALEEFVDLAPVELRTDEVFQDDHQLMLNRLNFELVERQRLEARRKELVKQKEALLKQSKAKQARMDSVKGQLDLLMKTASEVQKKVDELVPAPTTVSQPVEDTDVPMEAA